MPALFTIMGLVFVLMSTTIVSVRTSIARLNATDDAIALEQMAVYQSIVGAYAKTHPGTSGTVSDASLGVPAWFVRPAGVTNLVSGGKGYVWFTADSPARAGRIAARAQGTTLGGVNINGRMQQPGAATAGALLPTVIPEGAAVVTR